MGECLLSPKSTEVGKRQVLLIMPLAISLVIKGVVERVSTGGNGNNSYSYSYGVRTPLHTFVCKYSLELPNTSQESMKYLL